MQVGLPNDLLVEPLASQYLRKDCGGGGGNEGNFFVLIIAGCGKDTVDWSKF
mgnify:CR=1 FL=1